MPTVSYDVTAGQVTRINAAVGKILNLRDSNGVPRVATSAESRAFHIGLLRTAVIEQETREAQAAAVAAVSVSDLAIT